jgi:hypothetical protein
MESTRNALGALTVRLFPKPHQNAVRSCAQIAIIPTNSAIDVKAAASSTKIRNIVTSFGLEHTENNVPFLF